MCSSILKTYKVFYVCGELQKYVVGVGTKKKKGRCGFSMTSLGEIKVYEKKDSYEISCQA